METSIAYSKYINQNTYTCIYIYWIKILKVYINIVYCIFKNNINRYMSILYVQIWYIYIYKPISMVCFCTFNKRLPRHHSSTDSLWAVGQRRFDVLSPVVKTSLRHHTPRRNWKAWGMDVVAKKKPSWTRTKKKQEPVLQQSNSWCSFLLVCVHLMAGKYILETFSGMHWNFWMRYSILI